MTDQSDRIAYLQAEQAKLEAKRNDAISRVEQRGRAVQIDLAAVDRALSAVTAELAQLQNGTPMLRRLLPLTFSKGL